MVISLRFINQSQATDNPIIAITCAEASAGVPVVAWHIIRNIGPGSNYPFTYSSELGVVASDDNGNYTAQLSAQLGTAFSVRSTASGNQLVYDGTTLHPDAISVKNLLPSGRITAFLYRDQNVCAKSGPLRPNTRVNFSFAPLLYIGRAASVTEGDISTSAVFAVEPVRISLNGVTNADIVMKGGGESPLLFSVENINRPE